MRSCICILLITSRIVQRLLKGVVIRVISLDYSSLISMSSRMSRVVEGISHISMGSRVVVSALLGLSNIGRDGRLAVLRLVSLNRLVVVGCGRAVWVNRVTEARSVKFFAGGISNLVVMALREQGWLSCTIGLSVAVVDIRSEHTVSSLVLRSSTLVLMLDFAVVVASVPNGAVVLVFNAERLLIAVFTFIFFSHASSSIEILLRVSAHRLEVVWLQVGYWLAYRRASSQGIACFFRVVIVGHALSVNSNVSGCLRVRFVEYLRLLVKYPVLFRVFLHILKELNAALNL